MLNPVLHYLNVLRPNSGILLAKTLLMEMLSYYSKIQLYQSISPLYILHYSVLDKMDSYHNNYEEIITK